MVRPAAVDSRGILDPGAGLARYRHARHEPSADVSRFVAWYWVIEWNLGDDVHAQDLLPHPVVNVVFGEGAAVVQGVTRGRVTRELRESGRVLGVMFRPAGFRPFLGRSMATLTDRSCPAGDVLGPAVAATERAVGRAADHDEMVAHVDAFLAAAVPPDRQPSEDTTGIVERVAADRAVLRAGDLAREAGMSLRSLQRRFADHVGASPKWVIGRYRLYEAAERAARGDAVDWSRLAAELGYSDQSHLVRHFTAAVGVPPDRYARDCTPPAG